MKSGGQLHLTYFICLFCPSRSISGHRIPLPAVWYRDKIQWHLEFDMEPAKCIQPTVFKTQLWKTNHFHENEVYSQQNFGTYSPNYLATRITLFTEPPIAGPAYIYIKYISNSIRFIPNSRYYVLLKRKRNIWAKYRAQITIIRAEYKYFWDISSH
jgi:hypothetical protein